jgi:signal transduction histidine kinase
MNDSTQPTQPMKPTTILYIEDDPASRQLVERALRYLGYRVVVAERGLLGIDLARRENPDLILTDINLPDISGRELTTRLRADERFSRTPIVALTAQALQSERTMAMAAGVTGYLTKPVDIEVLPKQIEYYLHGGQDLVDRNAVQQAQTKYTQEVVARLEERLRTLEDYSQDLERLDRMKNSFINITAHELRTPLTLVYGYNRLMEDNPYIQAAIKHDPNTRVLVEGMTTAIQRMNLIVNEVLTISRIITNRIELSLAPTNLTEIIARVLKGYSDALRERKLIVRCNPTEFPQQIRADWELLELAFRNLISNAIKYTPDGGTITITARPETPLVWRVCVRDTGVGISSRDHTRIFENFSTTHDPMYHSTSKTAFMGGGIGLGLAVCKGIFEAHGGKIWVESPGYDATKCPGSEFIVLIPANAHASAGAAL